MTNSVLRANFTISDRAKAAIKKLQADYDARFPHDPAAVAAVAWGYTYAKEKLESEGVTLGFYPRSMLPEVADGIQTVSGMELIFFTTPSLHLRFAGKILDFDDAKGFVLGG